MLGEGEIFWIQAMYMLCLSLAGEDKIETEEVPA